MDMREPEEFVNGIFDMFLAMKASHGLVTAGREYLAEIWDKPESDDADQARNICRVYTMGE
ncbi:hypothetical protein GB937_004552 [Aspergillus fischeri]|nr:hypothetical protein GB937_004552 [Aspergillus fischeri]